MARVVGKGQGLRRIESAVVAAVAVTLSLGAWWWTSIPDDVAPVDEARFEASTSGPAHDLVTVHVAGAVRRPGVVRLEAGSRVVDAIEAAGGATSAATLAGVNLAAEVADGSQVMVPSQLDGTGGPSSTADPTVAINTASASDLESLPGVGPVLAGRIVAHRDANGPFRTVEDLLDVSGIGEATLARLRPFVRIP